jgi:hypothetical protein
MSVGNNDPGIGPSVGGAEQERHYSRRAFIQGLAGLAAVAVLGGSGIGYLVVEGKSSDPSAIVADPSTTGLPPDPSLPAAVPTTEVPGTTSSSTTRPESTTTSTIPNEAELKAAVTLSPEQAAKLPVIPVASGSTFKEYLSGQTDPSTAGGPWPAPNNPWRTPYIETEPLNGRTAHVVAHQLNSISSVAASPEEFEDLLNHGPVWDSTTKFFGQPGVSIIASHDVTLIVGSPVEIQGRQYDEEGAGYNNDAIQPGDELEIWVTTPHGGSRLYVYENIVDQRLSSLPNPNVVQDTQANYDLIEQLPPDVSKDTNVLRIYMCWPQWNKPDRKIFSYQLKSVVLYPTAQSEWLTP